MSMGCVPNPLNCSGEDKHSEEGTRKEAHESSHGVDSLENLG
jgi:hypothetical protein